jgi:hypothetical protein
LIHRLAGVNIPVFSIFPKNLDRERARGVYLKVVGSCVVDSGFDQLFAYALSAEAFVHFGVIDDKTRTSGIYIGKLSGAFAIVAGRTKRPAAIHFDMFNIHKISFPETRKVRKGFARESVCTILEL